ncbi:hypothetical protein [Dyella tabacisoli]|uniref:hypothetical protein n=1 Tax=Dyella tabacisoli TaxID=2282381 RepID=UPI001CDC929D|nr:hypothetical protein [Dyella tabacisoli]
MRLENSAFLRELSIPISFCEYDVKKVLLNRALMGASMLVALALTGCGTPAAKDFRGTWKPVNRFQESSTEIPLAQPYTFYASPMDGTLKTMLTRWSKDTGMVLSYQLHSDFTLYKPVTQIHTPNIKAAAAELSAIYAAQGVSIVTNERQILVDQASASSSDTTPDTTPDTATNKEAAGAPKPAAAASTP